MEILIFKNKPDGAVNINDWIEKRKDYHAKLYSINNQQY
jgi:hypothetical protein